MTENPYRSTTTRTGTNSGAAPRRRYGVGLSILSGIVGLAFGWQILVTYAFSTMVDPQIRGGERARLIAHGFLFGDGPFQIVMVCLFMYLGVTGMIAAHLFLAFAILHRPPLKMAAVISCCAGAVATISIVGFLLTR